MKKTIQYTLLTGCALGILALSNKIAVADDFAPAMSCCSGMAMATPTANSSTIDLSDLLKTCPVSDEKLDGGMVKPFEFAYQGQEAKLCCKSCKKDFDKNPDKHLKLIRAANKK
jgi:YHS domain-containing protein